MKLIVQIPCLNEEATLPETLRAVPRSIPGIDVVEAVDIVTPAEHAHSPTSWATRSSETTCGTSTGARLSR